MRVINKDYDRSVKKILAEPTRRNPHTRVSSSLHLSPATGEKNPEYSIVLSKTYPTGGKKRLQGYARLMWLVGCICRKHY